MQAMSLSICQLPNQQFVRKCTAKIIGCRALAEILGLTEEAKSKPKGKKDEAKKPSGYGIELNQSCLFPEGGGQPADFGWLTSKALGRRIAVTNVQRLNGAILHYVEEQLPVDEEVEIEVDWERREDHMQQHTSQHLLSAIFRRDFQAITLGWSMANYPEESMIELDIPAVTQEMMQKVTETANDLIRAATQVKVHVFPSASAALEDPIYMEAVTAGRAKKFPEGLVGPARCIEIVGLEMNTCCGIHVANLAQLQAVAILRSDKVKGHSRIYFNAGKRLITTHIEMHKRQCNVTKLLGVPAQDQEDALDKLLVAYKAKMKEVDGLLSKFAEVEATALAQGSDSVVTYHEENGDLKTLSALASAFALTPGGKSKVLLATATSHQDTKVDKPTTGDKQEKTVDGLFVLSGDPALVALVGPVVAKILGGRGGGRPGTYQGKGTQFDRLENAIQEARQLVAQQSHTSQSTSS